MNEDDKILLEQAMGAYGYGNPTWDDDIWQHLATGEWHQLNPLDDDGDALRMAMAFDMTLALDGRGVHAQKHGSRGASAPECTGEEKAKLVRRSIVRVAAYSGKVVV